MNRTATPAHPPIGVTTFAERLHAMRQELDQACQRHAHAALTADERDHLKQEIIVLFREADAALQQAMAWKEAVKGLADQWKQLDGRPAVTVPNSASAAAPARVDHLGASTFIEKGWSKLSLLDAVGAEAAFRRALDLAPGASEAEALLAWAQMQQGHFDDALSTLQAVLQRDPHHALAHVNLGYICLRTRKYGEAIEHLSTVVRADGDRRAVLYAHLYLGMVYREREMYDDAETFFRKSLELGPNLLQAWYELGRAYWFAGRRGDACLAWKTGSEANKFSPWGKRCAEILEVVEQGARRGARLIARAWAACSRGAAALSLVAVLSVLGGLLSQPAAAQSVDRDPGVRLDAGRFTVVAEQADARLARTLLAVAQQRDTFPGLPRPRARVLIAIAPDAARLRAWVGPRAPEWGAAFAFPDQNRIVMQGRSAGSEAGDPRVVLRHELAHLALHEAMGALPPRWFDEGYASFAAGEWTREQAFETSVGMVWRTLPTLEQLERGFAGGGMEASWSYAMAHRVVSELDALGGPVGLTNMLRYWKQTSSFEKAVRGAYGLTGEAFEKHWRARTRSRYGALSFVTNVSLALGLFSFVLVPLFVIRKRRDRRKMEAMRQADALQEAEARRSALQAILDGAAVTDALAADAEPAGVPGVTRS